MHARLFIETNNLHFWSRNSEAKSDKLININGLSNNKDGHMNRLLAHCHNVLNTIETTETALSFKNI